MAAASESRQIENLPTLTKLEEEKFDTLKAKLAITDISESAAFKTFFKFCYFSLCASSRRPCIFFCASILCLCSEAFDVCKTNISSPSGASFEVAVSPNLALHAWNLLMLPAKVATFEHFQAFVNFVVFQGGDLIPPLKCVDRYAWADALNVRSSSFRICFFPIVL